MRGVAPGAAVAADGRGQDRSLGQGCGGRSGTVAVRNADPGQLLCEDGHEDQRLSSQYGQKGGWMPDGTRETAWDATLVILLFIWCAKC